LKQLAVKKRWSYFCQQPPSVENVSSILPNPPATATKKHQVSDSKDFDISAAILKTC
jgi:hypothetical protein